MKKFLLIFFVVLLCSVVFSQVVDGSEIDVFKLFVNAEQTVDSLTVSVPVLAGSISSEISVDNESLIKYMDRFDIPEEERDSWLESNVLEEDFEIAKGSAHRIRNEKNEYSDYFVWVKKIDFDKKQVSVYIITRAKGYGAQEESAVVEKVSLREFRIVSCGVKGVLGVGESYSCLLPELDGSTITITIKSVNSKKLVSLRVKWGYSFFRDVFWEDRWLNIEYAGKHNGYVVRKDSEDEFIKYSDLMVEDSEQYVFKFSTADTKKDVSYLVFVSGLDSEEVRFSIGYVGLDRKVSWLDFETTKEFSADRIPSEFIGVDCAPDELWVNELVFTKEELENGKNIKTCYIGDFSEPTEIIQVKVDSVSNEGRTLSFKVKHVDVSSAFDKIAKILGKEGSSMLDVFGSQKVVDLFLTHPNEFVEIAEAAGTGSEFALNILAIDAADLFIGNPGAFVEIAKAAGVDSGHAFRLFGNEKVTALFVDNPDVVVDALVYIAENYELSALLFLVEDDIADLFADNPDVVVEAFVDITEAVGTGSVYEFYAFLALGDERGVERFLDYCNKKISFDQFMVTIFSSSYLAIETGRPLDDLHFQQEEREQYLDSLSTLRVFALLNSNPEFFYTSSNNMLFDRLKTDLGDKSITQLFEEYGLIGSDEARNFLFRAINYDRFYGKENSLLGDSDVKALLPTLLEPLNSDEFDKEYLFLLANALDNIKGTPELINQVKQVSEKRLQEGIDDKELKAGFEFIAVLVDEETNLVSEEKKMVMKELDKRKIFDPGFYMNFGKLTVLQVFDKEDIHIEGKVGHFEMTETWFRNSLGTKPVLGESGETILESGNAKMILFMGETEKQNQEFIKKQLSKTPNMIVTFRGHSYSLLDSFPYDIFGNNDSHVLFIPGSCGSAGSTPNYIYVNSKTDLRFISNTSTGKGQVTNVIVGALLESNKRSFQSVIADSTASIVKYGGEVSSIKLLTKGELLIRYVLDETRQ